MLNDFDFGTLKNNVKAIEGYCLSLMPNVRKTIKVKFGETTIRRGNYGMPCREQEFEFVLSPTDLWGFSGCLRYDFEKDPDSSSAVYVYGRGFGEKYMMSLVRYWPYIKQRIHSEISAQQRELDAIHSFVL